MKKMVLFLSIILISSSYAQRQAFVINGLAETLSIIDLENGQVVNHAVTLGEAPNQAAWHDSYLYVVNSISADIMKIDPATRQVVADIYLPIGSNPYYMAFSNGFCFVTGFVSGVVYKIDLSTNEISGQAAIGGYPEGIIYADDHVYVTQTYFNPNDYSYGQGKVSVLNAETMAIEGQFDVGKNPQWISKSSNGDLHIVCTGNYFDIFGSVYMYDPQDEVIVDSVNIGGTPANLAISPLGIGYLAAGGWADVGFIYAYDIDSREIINGVNNPIESGLGATSVAVDSLGFLYSSDMGDDTVTKMSSSGGYLGSFALGDGPISIAIIDDAVLDVEDDPVTFLPENLAVWGNYPNPFNAGTIIGYELPADVATGFSIEVYDGLGRLIKSIMPGTAGGNGSVLWDGTDSRGIDCSSGIYFAGISIAGNDDNRQVLSRKQKMVLLR